MPDSHLTRKDFLLLLLFTAGSILVHGYHPFVEDAEIYVPGIKHVLNPTLYPYNAAFFTSHAHLTLFPNLIAGFIRLTHVSVDWSLFLWHFLSIFLLLLACWRLGKICFRDTRAPWGGVALVASLLTLPVAGTALYIMDQYLNTRSLSTPAVLFLIISAMQRKFLRAAAWAVFTAAIHPLMAGFGVTFVVLLLLMQRHKSELQGIALLLLPFGLFPPVTGAYREVMESHSYFFLLRWEWYEWLGIFGPLALLWWFHRIARKQQLPALDLLCRTLVSFGFLFFAIALLITVPQALANFAELQPMRSLHLVYVMFLVFAGGLLTQFVLQGRWWRWLLLFVPLCCGMWFSQRALFPATAHIEWPGAASSNEWVQAFLWIRDQTPTDAYFALDPDHMDAPGEDQHGFRAIAERSMLADRIKDSGAVTMFPALAETWSRQVRAQGGWKKFRAEDFLRLNQEFGVNWVVLQRPGVVGLTCPYQNDSVAVCRLE